MNGRVYIGGVYISMYISYSMHGGYILVGIGVYIGGVYISMYGVVYISTV